jgi:futalosine hydrolase
MKPHSKENQLSVSQPALRPGLWLISIAMPMEAELLISRLEPADPISHWPLWRGSLVGQEVVLQLSGMGLVNAASAVTAALERMPEICALINLGCAGAYSKSGLAVGQAALASQIVLADHGVRTSRKIHGLEKTGIPLVKKQSGDIYNHLPCSGELNSRLALPELARGVFACVAQVSGDPTTAAAVEERWGGILEDMESGAVAQVAAMHELPFACLRGVSNLAGARELEVKAGAEAAQRAFIKALGETP